MQQLVPTIPKLNASSTIKDTQDIYKNMGDLECFGACLGSHTESVLVRRHSLSPSIFGIGSPCTFLGFGSNIPSDTWFI